MQFKSHFHSLLGCCLLAAASTFVSAQGTQPAAPPPGTHVSPSATYDKLLSGMEKEFVDAAEAMPADKYGFKPSVAGGEFKDVRSFGEEVKHVAQANYYFFHDPDAPASDKSKAIGTLTSKDDIVKALKESFAEAHKYIAGITDENAFVMTKSGTRGGMAAFGIAHFMDHYGQMCVYLRMNGIVPPASRK
ncbi:DinB family protein [Acidicapsa dinghuensis]|uniref:DinB family protein n=1 Tax=Acidicapsa dinghuensis TaxID=2218256 RepID=A0ABW1EHW3_9BACT|nr:DinB family protein [Acidicapsa dinghuensis]